jgi:hypothetical protein
MTASDEAPGEGEAFSVANGDVRAWVDGGLHLNALIPSGDPAEFGEEEVRELLADLARFLHELKA